MKYKKSQFNSEIEEIDGGMLIFNTMTAAILWIPNELWECEVYDGEITDDWKTVIDSGIWVGEDRNEYEELKNHLKFSARNLAEDIAITIAPTYICNMKCEYCFQKDNDKLIMSTETADRIISAITGIISKYKRVNISWFGGEPLIAIGIIEYISHKIISFCNDYHIVYSADLITNGTLLNSENMDLLKRCQVKKIQVTLDGTTHDLTRKMKNGTSSYNIIIMNVIQAVTEFGVVIRSNVTEENVNAIKAMIDELMIKYSLQNKVFFSFYPVSSFEGKTAKKCDFNNFCHVNVYDSKLAELIRHVLKYQKAELIVNFILRPSTIPCEAICKNTVCFDAYGDVYKCALSMQNLEMKIGNINEQSMNAILNNGDQNGWLSFKWAEECKDCNFLPMCHSGCIFLKRAAGKSKLCSIDKTAHKQLVKLLYEDSEGENT